MLVLTLILFGCTDAPDAAALRDLNCSQGDAEACYQLGSEQLSSARPNYIEARRLLSMSCGTHHAMACNALGTLVRDARGGPKDLARAASLFQTSCEKGVQQACVHYADALSSGSGTTQNLDAAKTLYSAACEGEASIPRACMQLGLALGDERGVSKEDMERSAALLERACKADYPQACVEIANDYNKRWGKENVTEAATLYEKACRLDGNFGCLELAEMHASNKIPDANIEQAGHYYQLVCRLDSSRGCYELAELMTENKVPSRAGEKEALYKQACESGNSVACTKR